MNNKIIAIKNEQSRNLLSIDEYNKLWRLTGPLLGNVSLRQPTVLRTEQDLKKYPEMQDEIGGISIPTKDTYINVQKFQKAFGPFTQDDWNEIKKWIENEIDTNRDPKKTTVTRNLLGGIAEQVNSGTISIEKAGFQVYMIMLMGHEIGHHKWIPYDLKTLILIVDSVYKVTEDQDKAAYIANVYEDLVINDRLFSERGVPMHLLYEKMTDEKSNISPFWQLYMRTCELLWQQSILPEGKKEVLTFSEDLFKAQSTDISPELECDAALLVKIIRDSQPRNYIIKAKEAAEIINKYYDPQENSNPSPLDSDMSSGNKKSSAGAVAKDAAKKAAEGMSRKQEGENGYGAVRELPEYQGLMRRMNLADDTIEATIMYYLDLASPYAVQFPSVPRWHGAEVMEGVAGWDPSQDPIERLDLPLSLQQGIIIPGYTTLQREYVEGLDTKETIEPPDLLIYTDASGSMTNPNKKLSPLTLAGTIAVESALNSSKQVRACNYETQQNYVAMDGMSDNRNEIMKYLLNYNPRQGSTEFPFQDLVEAYDNYNNEPVHLVVISDGDFLSDLRANIEGKTGLQILEEMLLSRKGGGTLFLNSDTNGIITAFKDFAYEKIEISNKLTKIYIPDLKLTIYPVQHWNGLEAAAADMSQATYDPYGYKNMVGY
ncbi:MAG: hypothetical protein DKM50_00805 [Candidatus Margulisiibacteriota bacterium]|nr:MAG: hypothetical protein A2X43_05280 [Candidatus Margulisbacteria bacterium GWD2_39_127]PZM83955.1 MAG: hypothetical protein DKM50_00805 [Candidatus Margulisiibacteriota bacterium]HAR64453.1 hypothetical protein [Candidatus Margulisiibacteriota bacterium]HCY36482.1 hypothetical protein [Candidatus Margulisiibacteriota bacterium]